MPTFQILGEEELLEKLKQMGDEAFIAIENAVRDAGDVVLKSAQSKVPVKSGELSRSLGIEVRGKKGAWMGVRIKAQRHAHLVEFGHKLVRKGKQYGTVPAHPFLRPAYDETKRLARDTIITRIQEAIEGVVR